MKNKSIFAVLAIALALTINVAYAAPTAQSASIWIEDGSGNKINACNPGDTVEIFWNLSPALTTVDITVVDSAMNPITGGGPFLDQTEASNEPISVTLPSTPGYYFVLVNGVPAFTIASASIFVIPESMLGTLTATVAGFAAFATIGIVKHKHAKSK